MSINPAKAAPLGGVANNLGHRATGESTMRRFDPYEYRPTLRASRTVVVQVRCNCFADIRRQWKSFGTIAFAVRNHELAGSPIDIIKLKLCDFACPQAQTNKHG